MTQAAVLDASAALRLYLGDGPMPAGLEQDLAAATGGELVLLVPELFWIEVTHVLLRLERKGGLSADEVDELLTDLRRLPCQTMGHLPMLPAVAALAREHGLSGYDAAYVALARHHRARLLTADERLARLG